MKFSRYLSASCSFVRCVNLTSRIPIFSTFSCNASNRNKLELITGNEDESSFARQRLAKSPSRLN